MLRCAVLATLAVAAFAGPALAQPIHLQWKFKEGDKFYLEEQMLAETNATALGQKITEKQKLHRISSFVVKSVAGDGFVMEQRIESWKTQSEGGVAGLGDIGKMLQEACKDIVFVVKITRSGTVVNFEGHDKFLKKVTEAFPAEAEVLKSMLTEEALRAPLSLAFDLLPDKIVKKGDKWRKVCDVPIGGLGRFTFSTDFTHEGKGKGGDLLSCKGTMSWQPGKGELGMGIKLLKLDLTKNEHTGKIVFDAAKGRLVVTETAMPLVGNLKMEVQGMEIDVRLDGFENRTIRLHDKKPLPDV